MQKELMQQKLDDRDYFLKMCQFSARPYLICVIILSILLAISIFANVYLSTRENVVDIDNNSDFVNSNNNANYIVK